LLNLSFLTSSCKVLGKSLSPPEFSCNHVLFPTHQKKVEQVPASGTAAHQAFCEEGRFLGKAYWQEVEQ
jgi:hypothetical protein